MEISTPTWNEAVQLLTDSLLTDRVNIYKITGSTGSPDSVNVSTNLSTLRTDVPALVQSVLTDSQTDKGASATEFTVKIPSNYEMNEGDVILVKSSTHDRKLVNLVLTITSVSVQGMELIRKGIGRKTSVTGVQIAGLIS